MRTEGEVKERIDDLEKSYDHILTGELSTVEINAPRALMQLSTEARLQELYWIIGKTYKSKLGR